MFINPENDDLDIEQAAGRGYGIVVKVLHKAIILHNGWEMDNDLWIVQLDDGSVKAMTTNHGGMCYCSKEYIIEKIHETKNSLYSLEEALAMLPEDTSDDQAL